MSSQCIIMTGQCNSDTMTTALLGKRQKRQRQAVQNVRFVTHETTSQNSVKDQKN